MSTHSIVQAQKQNSSPVSSAILQRRIVNQVDFERILRVVLDIPGRDIMAFPAARFLQIGLSSVSATAAIEIFTESTAHAAERT